MTLLDNALPRELVSLQADDAIPDKLLPILLILAVGKAVELSRGFASARMTGVSTIFVVTALTVITILVVLFAAAIDLAVAAGCMMAMLIAGWSFAVFYESVVILGFDFLTVSSMPAHNCHWQY